MSLFAYIAYLDLSVINKINSGDNPIKYQGLDNVFIVLVLFVAVVINLVMIKYISLPHKIISGINFAFVMIAILIYGHYANDVSIAFYESVDSKKQYKICKTEKRHGKGVFSDRLILCLKD